MIYQSDRIPHQHRNPHFKTNDGFMNDFYNNTTRVKFERVDYSTLSINDSGELILEVEI